MERDVQRIARIREALRAKRVDAVVCTLPMNVLMVSGYWPFVGTTIAIATADGKIGIVVPQDAARVAVEGWADELETFRSGSLNELKALEDCVRGPLSQMVRRLGLSAACIVAYEDTADVEPASYAGMNVYGAALPALLSSAIPGICLASGGEMLAGIRAVLTESELKRLRIACEIVGCSFEAGHAALRSGLTETQVADAFRMGLSAPCLDGDAPGRADGFVYCMSGPNSALAYAAYQRSTARTVRSGDFVLVHCNSYVDGLWTDFTRTFCIGKPDERKRQMHEAILEASRAARRVVRPGVRAAEVDAAARNVLTERGFGDGFKHATGHGVGFSAINHLAYPRIHPKSDDMLEVGMTFNIEPAIYIEGFGGARHCDLVTVVAEGMELLTPFQEAA